MFEGCRSYMDAYCIGSCGKHLASKWRRKSLVVTILKDLARFTQGSRALRTCIFWWSHHLFFLVAWLPKYLHLTRLISSRKQETRILPYKKDMAQKGLVSVHLFLCFWWTKVWDETWHFGKADNDLILDVGICSKVFASFSKLHEVLKGCVSCLGMKQYIYMFI